MGTQENVSIGVDLHIFEEMVRDLLATCSQWFKKSKVFFFLLYLFLFCKFEIITLRKKRQDDGEKHQGRRVKERGFGIL